VVFGVCERKKRSNNFIESTMPFGTVGRPDRKGFDVILFQQHQDRLKNMKATVDCGPPRPHPLSNKSEMEKV
jgi:hypothetical protein